MCFSRVYVDFERFKLSIHLFYCLLSLVIRQNITYSVLLCDGEVCTSRCRNVETRLHNVHIWPSQSARDGRRQLWAHLAWFSTYDHGTDRQTDRRQTTEYQLLRVTFT